MGAWFYIIVAGWSALAIFAAIIIWSSLAMSKLCDEAEHDDRG